MKIRISFLIAMMILMGGSMVANPTGIMDPPPESKSSSKIIELINDLNKEAGSDATLSLISTDPEEIVNLLEKIAELNGGDKLWETYKMRYEELLEKKKDIARAGYYCSFVLAFIGGFWPMVVLMITC